MISVSGVEVPSEEQRVRLLISGAVAALESSLAAEERPYEELVVAALRSYVLSSARALELPQERALEARLFDAGLAPLAASLELAVPPSPDPASDLGYLLEGLLARSIRKQAGKLSVVPTRGRKQSGSFYTGSELTRRVTESCLAAAGEPATICDPAVGGGAFLLAVGRALARGRSRRELVEQGLYGVDISPLAIAVSEAALWLWAADPSLSPREVGRHLVVSDTLLGDWPRAFPEVLEKGGFDLVIGNPPWVAYAGRAAQPLPPGRRAQLLERFSAFKGYPTLHGLFVERATQIAPRGVIGLLLPSPLADLDGYRPVRRALTRTHALREPLLEFGQDAFASVTQPCFALIAAPKTDRAAGEDRPFRLAERQRKAGEAEEVRTPNAIERLLALPCLPRELFGEMGFQSRRVVTEQLFRRGPAAGEHDYPLLEGKDVGEFRVGPPRLFMKPDRDFLARVGCRLRDAGEYGRVRFVVRQTAKVTIAALHTGLPFRNSLIAGFEHEELPPELVVGLLNSALYRALHLARQRDARQATFPQVKVAHLRGLPRPPANTHLLREVASVAARATKEGMTPELRASLDALVFDVFEISSSERLEVFEFMRRRAPELGHGEAKPGKTSSAGVTLRSADA